MTIEEELAKFLTLEEAVAGLADRLEQLRSETERYDQARGHLDDAARQLDALISRLSEVTSGVGSVIETLRSIDTAALLVGQEEIAGRFAAVESGFAEARAQSGALQAAFEATGQSVVEAVGAVRSALDSLPAQLAGVEEALTGRLDALDARSSAAEERLAGLAAGNGASIEALAGKLERFESSSSTALEDQRALILSSAAETAKNVRSSLESFATTVSEGTNRLEAAEAATRQELQTAIRQLQGRVTIGFGALGALGIATLVAALIR